MLSVYNKGRAKGHRVTGSSVGKPLRIQHQARAETMEPLFPSGTRNTASERQRQGDHCKQLHAHPGNPSCTPRIISITEGELNPSIASATERTHQNFLATAPVLRTQTLGEP